jgi:DNA-binding MarR family transcriptional regulator
MTLTPTQLAILLNIRRSITSFRDLNAAIGNKASATGWMSQYLGELRTAGLVIWQPGQARTIQLTEKGRRAIAEYVLMPDGGVGHWEPVKTAKEPVYCTAREYEAMQS